MSIASSLARERVPCGCDRHKNVAVVEHALAVRYRDSVAHRSWHLSVVRIFRARAALGLIVQNSHFGTAESVQNSSPTAKPVQAARARRRAAGQAGDTWRYRQRKNPWTHVPMSRSLGPSAEICLRPDAPAVAEAQWGPRQIGQKSRFLKRKIAPTTASAAITPPTIIDSRSGGFRLSGTFDPAFRAAPGAAQKGSAIGDPPKRGLA